MSSSHIDDSVASPVQQGTALRDRGQVHVVVLGGRHEVLQVGRGGGHQEDAEGDGAGAEAGQQGWRIPLQVEDVGSGHGPERAHGGLHSQPGHRPLCSIGNREIRNALQGGQRGGRQRFEPLKSQI